MAGWLDEMRPDDDAPDIHHKRIKSETEMDMTPMIDCTFLLLIFFTVGAKLDQPGKVQLPAARYGAMVDPGSALIITLEQPEESKPARVYLGDGKLGDPLSGDQAAQEDLIREAANKAVAEKKMIAMIKAEKNVQYKELSRVARAATENEGVTLHVAVLDTPDD